MSKTSKYWIFPLSLHYTCKPHLVNYLLFPSFFLKDFIYLFDRERESAQAGGEAEAEGEADSPLSKEPRVGGPCQDPGIMTQAEGRHFTN